MNLKTLRVVIVAASLVVVCGTAEVLGQGRQRDGENRQPGGRQDGERRQEGRGGFGGGRFGGFMGDMMGPAVTNRQVEKYGEMLGLTADQKATIKVLHDGYTEQARETGQQARDEMEKLRDEMRDSEDREGLMQRMQMAMRKVRDERRKQDEGFTSDVKAVLTPAQLEKWPTVERMQRREAGVRRGFLSGERVDLFALMEENRLSAEGRQASAGILKEYEEEFDRELIKRNQWQEKQLEQMGQMRQEGDFEGIQKLIEEGRQLDVKVRDVNRKYAKQIENALPDADRSAWTAAFKRASFPDVYRRTQASEAIDAASRFKDLTPEQAESLSALRASHDKTLVPLNDNLAKAVEESEMNFNIGQAFGGGRGEDSPLGQLRREKRDLDRSTMESLRKILTPEQAAKLPRAEERGDREDRGPRRREGREQN